MACPSPVAGIADVAGNARPICQAAAIVGLCIHCGGPQVTGMSTQRPRYSGPLTARAHTKKAVVLPPHVAKLYSNARGAMADAAGTKMLLAPAAVNAA